MFGDDEGDVVVLFVGAEALDFVHDRGEGSLRRGFAMALQSFDEALFAELFVGGVVGFSDAVGVQGEGVPRMELAFSNFAFPILEDSQYSGGGFEALHRVVAVEEKGGKMTAIRVAQAAGGVVVFGEEERGEGAVGSIFAEELVHGAQEALRLIESDGALAA